MILKQNHSKRVMPNHSKRDHVFEADLPVLRPHQDPHAWARCYPDASRGHRGVHGLHLLLDSTEPPPVSPGELSSFRVGALVRRIMLELPLVPVRLSFIDFPSIKLVGKYLVDLLCLFVRLLHRLVVDHELLG